MTILSPEVFALINIDIDKEIERREKDRPSRVFIDGVEFDIYSDDLGGGETCIHLKTPIFCSGNGKTYKIEEVWWIFKKN